MITVVIPYFQRSAGVLQRALASIAAQRDCPLPIHVIVVDDASPVPADGEIAAAALPDSLGMTLIRQVNGGPGAARNAGLDAIPNATRYIAFLDSDDEWTADHLARATVALEGGFDFYFSDHYQLDNQVSAFVRASKIKTADHPMLPLDCTDLHAYTGDMIDQIMRGNVIGTSTVIYRRNGFDNLRFRAEYTNAGEDYLFWLGMVRLGVKIVFSTHPEATYGRGVNIYSGAEWGTPEHMLRIYNELKYRKVLLKEITCSFKQKLFLHEAIQFLRLEFNRDILHCIKHRKPLPLRLLLLQAHVDPMTFVRLPLALTRILAGR